MKQETFSDKEQNGQWSDAGDHWPSPPGAAPEPGGQARPVHDGTAANRPGRDRKLPAPLAIQVEHADLDDACRRTLRKLLAAGCTRANTPYSLEQFQVGEQELHYLKRHGFVHAQASALLQPVILCWERQKAGADVGKLTVVLNVHLA
jgi:hypothetical protein